MTDYPYGVDTVTGDLTLPAEIFCAAYVSNGGVIVAASREAGYKNSKAGSRLLKTPQVLARIRELKKDEGRRLMLEEAAVREELKRVGMARMRDVVAYDGDGKPKVKSFARMNGYGAASLQALKMTTEKRRIGKDEIETNVIEVKQHHKGPALIALCKILGDTVARESCTDSGADKSGLDASKLSVEERVVFRKLLTKMRGDNETVLSEDDGEAEGTNGA